MYIFSSTAVSFEALLTLDDNYNTALDDPATPGYTNLQNNLENLVCITCLLYLLLISVQSKLLFTN